MCILMLLDRPVAAHPNEPALGDGAAALSYAEVASLAVGGGTFVRARRSSHLAYLGDDSPALVVALFAAAVAEVAFVPIDARLPIDLVQSRLAGLDRPLVIADEAHIDAVRAAGHDVIASARFLDEAASSAPVDAPPCFDDAEIGLIVFGEDDGRNRGRTVSHHDLVSPVLANLDLIAAETDAPARGLSAHHQLDGIVARLANIYVGRPIVVTTPYDAEPSLVGASARTEPPSSARR